MTPLTIPIQITQIKCHLLHFFISRVTLNTSKYPGHVTNWKWLTRTQFNLNVICYTSLYWISLSFLSIDPTRLHSNKLSSFIALYIWSNLRSLQNIHMGLHDLNEVCCLCCTFFDSVFTSFKKKIAWSI